MNDHQLRQKQQQDAQRRFLSALSSGQVNVIDRFGNKVEAGQRILYKSSVDLIYEVVSVTPVLDLKAPPGLMTVTVSVAPFPIQVHANQLWPLAIVIGQPPDDAKQPERSLKILRPDGEPADVDTTQAIPQAEGTPEVQTESADLSGDLSSDSKITL